MTREEKLQKDLDLVEAKIMLLKIALEESEREWDLIRMKQQTYEIWSEVDSVENYYNDKKIVDKLLELATFQYCIISEYEKEQVA